MGPLSDMNGQNSSMPAPILDSSGTCSIDDTKSCNIDGGDYNVLEFIKRAKSYDSARVQYTVEARGVEYSVDIAISKTKKTFLKTILGPCSFNISPGRMLAIIGPSGAGKSTLLDILAGIIPSSRYKGKVRINKSHVSRALRHRIGYVMQSDHLYPLLTVRETLYFAAQLRLRGRNRKEFMDLVDITLDLLGLSSVANSYVGNDQIRGISGGERRRCTIGVDIIHQPSIIYLDEPTSGLDSSTALQIVKLLKGICSTGCKTVCMTIHQPSTQVYNFMSEIMFLNKGTIQYMGPPHGIVQYIEKEFGQPVPPFCNLAELALEYVTQNDKEDRNHEETSMIDLEITSLHPHERSGSLPHVAYANTQITEAVILSHRGFINIFRNPSLFASYILTYTVLGFTIASIFKDTGYKTVPAIQDLFGYYVFLIGLVLFSSDNDNMIHHANHIIFAREHNQEAYRSTSYNLASFVAMIPTHFARSFIIQITTYFIVGLPLRANIFFFQWIIFMLEMIMAGSFCLLLVCLLKSPMKAGIITIILFSIMYMLSGIFIPLSRISKGWHWTQAINFILLAYFALVQSLIGATDFDQDDMDHLNELYDLEDLRSKWYYFGMLCLFTVIFRGMYNIALVKRWSGKRS